MGTTKTTAPAGVPFIDLTREFDAPRDVLFRAWTEPELVKEWLGPDRYEMVIDEYDVRDGGRYRYVHKDPDGNEFGFHGVFHGTPTLEGFVQTFEFEGAPGHVSLDRLVLEDLGEGRTAARIHSVYQSVEARDAMMSAGMETGLNQGFARLDTLLEALKAPVH
ncbi:MAG TPA: SRPBCC family protein [Candidatus Limnocylindrales bacterium]|jgi:uncharacterized protein YndB with AHSA1/START domain